MLNDRASSFDSTPSVFSVIIFLLNEPSYIICIGMYYGVFFCSDASIFYAKGFIVSNASMFVMHEIIANGQKVQDNIIKYIPGTIIESLAIDSNLDIIYLVDGKSSSLKKYNIRSNQLITLISISASTGNIYICSITRNLLW